MKLEKALSKRRLELLFEIYAAKRDYLHSLAAKLKMNPSLCFRMLNSLHSAGILNKEKQGKEIFYSLAKESLLLVPILEEFYLNGRTSGSKTLFNLVKLIREREELKECRYILIFGSYALGTETKKSDIDILFVSDSKKMVARVVRELSILLHKQINALVYSEKEFTEKMSKKDPLVCSIVENPRERLKVK